MSKKFRFVVQGGGVFSRLLQCAITPLADIDFDEIHLTAQSFDYLPPESWNYKIVMRETEIMKRYGIDDPYRWIFDYVLDQYYDHTFQSPVMLPIGQYYNHKDNAIESQSNFSRLQEVARRIGVKQELHDRANEFLGGINPDDVLGVHVRLKDIDYNYLDKVNFQMYVDAIESILKNHSYKRIVVASDNKQSIDKLRAIFGNEMIAAQDIVRAPTDESDLSLWETENYFKEYYWKSPLIDVLSLAKCSTLLCRNSNVTNAAIVFGNFKEIYRFNSL